MRSSFVLCCPRALTPRYRDQPVGPVIFSGSAPFEIESHGVKSQTPRRTCPDILRTRGAGNRTRRATSISGPRRRPPTRSKQL
jgi:hypothetical protein